MAAPIIESRGVRKEYRLGERLGLQRTVSKLMGRSTAPSKPFEALKGVTFDVSRGECLGIIGANGCGKSTILQILTGITPPSGGHMLVRGRVLGLLAIGTGFHPDLTGRENVVLFGTIMGVPKRTIAARMDDVVAFAQLETHIDTPNKRYSNGMQARLSFAVAMLFPADVYLFDEVLAVVDEEFRNRCLEEIKVLIHRGATVIFVSHDHDQILELCHRALWLDRGEVRMLGPADEVVTAYVNHD